MLKNLINKVKELFSDYHRHSWYRVDLFIRRDDPMYMHEKYYCEHCNQQMHIIRHWDRIPKLTITQRKDYDSHK